MQVYFKKYCTFFHFRISYKSFSMPFALESTSNGSYLLTVSSVKLSCLSVSFWVSEWKLSMYVLSPSLIGSGVKTKS